MLPELADVLRPIDTSGEAWFEILAAFQSAYASIPYNDAFIGRVYGFATWCIEASIGDESESDLFTSTVLNFYQSIPACIPARTDMIRWFTYQDFVANEQTLRYHLSDDEFLDLKQLFYRHHKKQRHSKTRDA